MARPAPQPDYIFRSHQADINSLCIFDNDDHFASADIQGHVKIWSLRTRRPILQWKAHHESCLSVHAIGSDTLISQGRDHAIHIWKFQLESHLPPTLDYTLEYACMGFCKLAAIQWQEHTLLALPAKGDTHMIDVFDLHTKKWRYLDVGDASNEKRRLCMTVSLATLDDDHLCLVAGYEDGSIACYHLDESRWTVQWSVELHQHPVLSLAIHQDTVLSTSLDNQVIKYNLADGQCLTKITSKKSGLACVDIRSDNKIFATGGYDARIRVYSMKTMTPLAVLSYHQDSVYTLSFCQKVLPNENHWLLAGSKDGRISLWALF
ncbi:WD40 repeat-like protein [Hesseltinella vesiculosa]|uniref:ASTRA-associated protein 1 n=1 Tax=Hesseltinella vesiculosa TaxID=101127 RepID=A0A1X2GY96_9FUNG|nr:WD40 repeat-like protein [Hesseltinella vesiculosa]